MKPPEKRNSPLRRQTNEAFLGADGRFSVTKVIAIAAQIVLLYRLGVHFEVLAKNWESFATLLTFLVAPDTFKKLIAMKYSGGSSERNSRRTEL